MPAQEVRGVLMTGEPAGLNRSLPGPLRCDVLQLYRLEHFRTALSFPISNMPRAPPVKERNSFTYYFPPFIMNKVIEALASEETLHLIHNPAQRQTLLDQLIADRWSSEDEMQEAFTESLLYFLSCIRPSASEKKQD